jgi:hypothetical protein
MFAANLALEKFPNQNDVLSLAATGTQTGLAPFNSGRNPRSKLPRRHAMKSLSTILAAALVAGSCTVALAQAGAGGSAGGSGGADSTQQGTMKDADKNPTGAGASPAAGNTGSAPTTGGQAGTTRPSGSGMQTAPASNTRSDSPQRPAGAKDNTGASTGQGGTK